MSIPEEKPPIVPPPRHEQVRRAQRRQAEPLVWGPYFAGALAVMPLAELWLVPALGLSTKTGHAVAIVLAVLAGFLTQAIYKRFHEPSE